MKLIDQHSVICFKLLKEHFQVQFSLASQELLFMRKTQKKTAQLRMFLEMNYIDIALLMV